MKLFKSLNILMVILMILSFSACGKEDEEVQIEINTQDSEEEPENFPISKVYLGCIKGTSAIGLTNLMQLEEEEQAYNSYKFTITDSIDELIEKLLNDKIQIATIPTNLASILYNKTNGNIQIAAISTLGGLYVIENGDSIKSIEDLADKTIYIPEKESDIDYIFNCILNENPIKNIKIEYKEPAELFALMSSGEAAVGIFSEPYASTLISENPNLKIALNINDEWKKVSKIVFDTDMNTEQIPNISEIMTSCIAVRKDYSEKHPRVFGHFLQEYYDSIIKAQENPKETAKLVEKFGIVTKADIAEKVMANSNITYIDNKEMEVYIKNFLSLLYNFNPNSIGGKLPGDDFFYIPKEKYTVQKK